MPTTTKPILAIGEWQKHLQSLRFADRSEPYSPDLIAVSVNDVQPENKKNVSAGRPNKHTQSVPQETAQPTRTSRCSISTVLTLSADTMPYRKISDDLKEAAIRLKERGRDTNEEIVEITRMSMKTISRAEARKTLTGTVALPPAIGRGRPRILVRDDCEFLLALARYKPSTFLDEYMRKLDELRGAPVSLATIHRTFTRAGLSVKRLQKLAAERDPLKRSDFIRRIGQYPAHYLISIDEVSKDDRTYARLWGRAPVGERAEEHNPFVRKRRYSMCAAMALDEGIIAARVLEGSFTHDTFLEFLRDEVLPRTNPYPGPRSVLMADNARIHHSDEITALIESYGCRIEYLPPYSPDYQPIEQAFSVIKSHLRRQGLSFYSPDAHYYELYASCQLITPEMTWGFFRHAGYI